MKIEKVKISQLPVTDSLKGLSVMGVGSDGRSCSADLEAAAGSALDMANHPTKVGEDNFLYSWNGELQEYVKRDIRVKGGEGEPAYGSFLEEGGDPAVTEKDFNALLADMPGVIGSLSLPITAVVTDASSPEPVPGALVSVYADGRKIGAAVSDAAGTATPGWFVTEQEYNGIRQGQEKIGVASPRFHYAGSDLYIDSGTYIIYLRTPADQAIAYATPLASANDSYQMRLHHYKNTNDGTTMMRVQYGLSGNVSDIGIVQPDSDYVVALRINAGTEVCDSFLYDRTISQPLVNTTPTTNKGLYVGISVGGSSPYEGTVYGLKVFDSMLSDAEIFTHMADICLTGAKAHYLPSGLDSDAMQWNDVSGNYNMAKYGNPIPSLLYRGQLKAVFSKEGYAGEIRYAQLPDYAAAAAGGIDISQAMRPGSLAVDPEEISIGYSGGSRAIHITSPRPVLGALPLAGWITLSHTGNTVTATFAENIATEKRNSGIVVFTGDRRLSIPIEQEGIPAENHISFVVDSSDGTFTVPLAASTLNGQSYSLGVYVNGVFYGTASGVVNKDTGTGYALTGLAGDTATILLRPTQNSASPAIGWGRAFGFSSSTEGCDVQSNRDKLLKVINDHDYAHCYSAAQTGYAFRERQFYKCSRLTNTVPENLPDTIVTLDDSYRWQQYAFCTSLTEPAEERMPDSVTAIRAGFRRSQYNNCSGITHVVPEVYSPNVTTIGGIFRYYQYAECVNVTETTPEIVPPKVTTIPSYYRAAMYYLTSVTEPAEEVMPDTVTHITALRFRQSQYYGTKVTRTAKEVIPKGVQFILNSDGNNDDNFRCNQYLNCYQIKDISNYVHAYGFEALFNSSDTNYKSMFYSNLLLPLSYGTMPRYYTNPEETETAPVTDLIPAVRKYYVFQRTGILGYGNLDPNWK